MHRNWTTFMAVALALVSGFTLTPSAHAGNGANCAKGYFCVYADGNLNGEHKDVNSKYQDLGSFKDKASSWYNRTRYTYCVYDFVNGSRKQLDQVKPGEAVRTIPDGTNDRADAAGRC